MPAKTTTTTTKTTTTSTGGSSSISTYAHYRLNAWVGMMVLSLVSLISIVAATDHKQRDFQERWCLALTGISMCLGFFGCMGHAVAAAREKFVSSIVELVMANICVACWIFSLPMITTPNDGLAVNPSFQVDNANLYFASWGAFMFALILLASVCNERGMKASRDGFARRWLWLIVSSVVVMAASARMFDSVCQRRNAFQAPSDYCRELKLGISMGVISAVMAGFMFFLMWTCPERAPLAAVGAFFAACMMVIWGVVVSYLTFDNGPATTVGNLFFAIWVSAILALDLGVCYLMAFMAY